MNSMNSIEPFTSKSGSNYVSGDDAATQRVIDRCYSQKETCDDPANVDECDYYFAICPKYIDTTSTTNEEDKDLTEDTSGNGVNGDADGTADDDDAIPVAGDDQGGNIPREGTEKNKTLVEDDWATVPEEDTDECAPFDTDCQSTKESLYAFGKIVIIALIIILFLSVAYRFVTSMNKDTGQI